MSEIHESREGSPEVPDARPQPHILVENIEGVMLELFQDMFEHWGYTNLILAYDHAEAISLAEEHHFDLIVLDFASPGGGTGYGATETIKAMYEGRGGVFIIGFGGYGQRAEERFMEAGADAFVSTPFSIYEVEDVVHRFLPAAGSPPRSS